MLFSLRQTLFISFGIILTLFVLTSVYVNYESNKIHTIEDRLLKTRLPTVLTSEKLLDGIHLSIAGLRGHVILGGAPSKADTMKAERTTAWAKIDQMINDYERLSLSWTDVNNLERLTEIKQLIEAFRQSQRRVEEITHTPDNIESINQLLVQSTSTAVEIKQLLNKLNESQEASAKKDTVSLLAEKQNLEMASSLMSAISVIIGIGTAVYLSQSLSTQLRLMVTNAEEMAKGNLVIPSLQHGKVSDFNSLADALNDTRDKLNLLVSHVVKSSDGLHQHSGQLKSLITESAQVVEQQQQETDMIATAMHEMSATVREVAQNTSDAAMSAEDADKSTKSGQNIIVETVDSINALAQAIDNAANTINQLNDETNAVDTILVSISGIADQTNLLALNAAIEAARAGEQGRGFAVVADEVRTLAARTQEATTEIRAMLDNLKIGTSNAVDVMGVGHKQAQSSVEKANTAKAIFQSITETVNIIKDMNTQIATAAEEQSAVAEEMSRNVTSINTGSDRVVEQSQASLQAANEMAGMASQLAESVAQFNINRDDMVNAS